MRNKLVQALFALVASVLVVGCIVILAWRIENWIPLAVAVGALAALFTLIAYQLRKGKG